MQYAKGSGQALLPHPASVPRLKLTKQRALVFGCEAERAPTFTTLFFKFVLASQRPSAAPLQGYVARRRVFPTKVASLYPLEMVL
jgi:hypothetical protein